MCCCACRLHCTTFKLGVLCGELHVHRADVCMCRIPSHSPPLNASPPQLLTLSALSTLLYPQPLNYSPTYSQLLTTPHPLTATTLHSPSPSHPLHSVVASLQQGYPEVEAHLDQCPRVLPTGGCQHLEEHHRCSVLTETRLVGTQTCTQLCKFLNNRTTRQTVTLHICHS